MPQVDVQAVLTNSWQAATNAQSVAMAEAQGASSLLSFTPVLTPAKPTPPTLVPESGPMTTAMTALNLSAGGQARSMYEALQTSLETKLKGMFEVFLSANFPKTELTAVQIWLDDQVKKGGAGINAELESALWQRDADRLQISATRATEDMLATFSSRRFTIPPGAAAYQALMMQRDAYAESAKSSRERALETWKTELDLVKFALSTTIDLRSRALAATGEYVREIAVSLLHGERFSLGVGGLAAQAANAAISFYGAQTQLNQVQGRFNLETTAQSLDAAKTALNANVTLKSRRADVAMGNAHMLGTLAAAALNGAHVNVSYGEQRDVTGTA